MWIYTLDPKTPGMKLSEMWWSMEANGRGITSFPTLSTLEQEKPKPMCACREIRFPLCTSLLFVSVLGDVSGGGEEISPALSPGDGFWEGGVNRSPNRSRLYCPWVDLHCQGSSPDASHRGRGRWHWEPLLLNLRLRMAPLWSLLHTSPSSTRHTPRSHPFIPACSTHLLEQRCGDGTWNGLLDPVQGG